MAYFVCKEKLVDDKGLGLKRFIVCARSGRLKPDFIVVNKEFFV